ncbi:MAG: hypothetical protein RBQ88_04650 [Desulfobulbus oligotrophicus]|nr:hypothetical protein [Desulfobulbus oligotrophicus]
MHRISMFSNGVAGLYFSMEHEEQLQLWQKSRDDHSSFTGLCS